jgi:Flp pilus assembly protein TadG
VSGLSSQSSSRPSRHNAQALVEFSIIVPVMLLMVLGLIDLGRAFVFGVAVQEGTRQAARVAATASYDSTLTDAAVLGRLVAASNPALIGCASQTASQTCNGGNWTFTVNVLSGGSTYSSISAARSANALVGGAQVTITAAGSVALLPGVSTGMYGLRLPQLNVQGQTAMVIL